MKVSLAAFMLVVCCATAGAAQRAPKPVVHTVTIEATSFKPASLTIRPGDTVEWINKDLMPHTATASGKEAFDSGTLATGKSWRRTFKTAGDVPYVCTFHPAMKGTVQVRK